MSPLRFKYSITWIVLVFLAWTGQAAQAGVQYQLLWSLSDDVSAVPFTVADAPVNSPIIDNVDSDLSGIETISVTYSSLVAFSVWSPLYLVPDSRWLRIIETVHSPLDRAGELLKVPIANSETLV